MFYTLDKKDKSIQKVLRNSCEYLLELMEDEKEKRITHQVLMDKLVNHVKANIPEWTLAEQNMCDDMAQLALTVRTIDWRNLMFTGDYLTLTNRVAVEQADVHDWESAFSFIVEEMTSQLAVCFTADCWELPG